jgi:hypothetical protein
MAQETQKPKKQRTIALWGHVKDSFTKSGIPNVKLTLMTVDSTVVDTMRAFNMGKFLFRRTVASAEAQNARTGNRFARNKPAR